MDLALYFLRNAFPYLGVMVGWVTRIGYIPEIRQLLEVRAVRRLPRGTPLGVFAVFFRVA